MDKHVFDLIPGYALDSLDEPEMLSVAAHLAGCETCQVELHAYQQVADQLALATPLASPAPEVKQRLMARVKAPAPTALTSGPMAGQSWVQRIAGWFSRPGLGLAALAVVMVLAVAGAWLWRSSQTAQPALRVVNLAGTTHAPGATGVLVLSDNGEYGTLVVDHLPELPPNQQYQLWLVKDGQRTSGGIFSVSNEGYASLGIASPQPLISYSSFGITIEPQGGSPGPTGNKVLGGNMSLRQY